VSTNEEVILIAAKLRALFPTATRVSLYVQSDSRELQVTQTERLGAVSYHKTLNGQLIPEAK
jgi:hypothetical protein